MVDWDAWLFWGLLWLQLGGLASLFAFRLPLSERASRWCFAGFFACLTMVGLGTLLAVSTDANCWICPAFSLGLLTVGAACEPAVRGDTSY